MAKIHWSVYVIVGLFVSVFSYKLNYEKLIFFFYIGLVFIVIGFTRMVLGWGKKGKEDDKHGKVRHQQVKYCPKCGNMLKLHDKFCTRCGAKA